MTASHLLALLIIANSTLFSMVKSLSAQSNDELPYVKGIDKYYLLASRDYSRLDEMAKDYVNRALRVSAIFNNSVLENIQDVPDNNLLVNILDLQKTGSTSLNSIFKGAVSAVNNTDKLLLVPGVKSYKNFHCVHHADVEHIVDCMVRGKNKAMSDASSAILFITMLREPVSRLLSEYNHLKSQLSCVGRAWKIFHPILCQDQRLGNYTSIPNIKVTGKDWEKRNNYMSQVNNQNESVNSSSSRFLNWLKVGPLNCACNRMTRQIAGPFGCVYSESDDLVFDEKKFLESAKYNLRHRFLFGITENYVDSLFHIQKQLMLLNRVELAKWLSKIPITNMLNMTAEDRKHEHYLQRNSSVSSLSTEELLYAKKCAKLDLELYEYGLQLFNARRNARTVHELYK